MDGWKDLCHLNTHNFSNKQNGTETDGLYKKTLDETDLCYFYTNVQQISKLQGEMVSIQMCLVGVQVN